MAGRCSNPLEHRTLIVSRVDSPAVRDGSVMAADSNRNEWWLLDSRMDQPKSTLLHVILK
jgi:hypothetical protein